MYNKTLAKVELTQRNFPARISDAKRGEVVEVVVRIEKPQGQEPYLSITGAVYRGTRKTNNPYSCGQVEAAFKQFPSVMKIRKWHLWSRKGAMHYVANTTYWLGWEGWWGANNPDLNTALKLINWGVLPTDGEFPAELYAPNHQLMTDHSDDLARSIDWFLEDHPEFAYMRSYVQEHKDMVRELLMARQSALLDLMYSQIDEFFAKHGQEINSRELFAK